MPPIRFKSRRILEIDYLPTVGSAAHFQSRKRYLPFLLIGKGSHMPKLPHDRLPKYRKHRASGQAVVTLNGVDHYLGPYGSKASHVEYDRLIGEWIARGRMPATGVNDTTIVELIAAFRRFAVQHYRKNGALTQSVANIDDSIRPLKALYGRELVREFGPLKLQALQAGLVRQKVSAPHRHWRFRRRGAFSGCRFGRGRLVTFNLHSGGSGDEASA